MPDPLTAEPSAHEQLLLRLSGFSTDEALRLAAWRALHRIGVLTEYPLTDAQRARLEFQVWLLRTGRYTDDLRAEPCR